MSELTYDNQQQARIAELEQQLAEEREHHDFTLEDYNQQQEQLKRSIVEVAKLRELLATATDDTLYWRKKSAQAALAGELAEALRLRYEQTCYYQDSVGPNMDIEGLLARWDAAQKEEQKA